jgi:hypothetical protein
MHQKQVQKFWLENLKQTSYKKKKNSGVDGKNNIIKMGVNGTGYEVAEWINLAQDRDQWRALTNWV